MNFRETKNNEMIKTIDGSTVHRLCSGQVIVDLRSCVKELVENALDAGAKSIQVRLVNYGADMIEVVGTHKLLNRTQERFETIESNNFGLL